MTEITKEFTQFKIERSTAGYLAGVKIAELERVNQKLLEACKANHHAEINQGLLDLVKKMAHYIRCTEAVFSGGNMYLDMTLMPRLASEAEAAIAEADTELNKKL